MLALQLFDVDNLLVNRKFLEPFEPIQTETHFTLEGQKQVVQRAIRNWEEGLGAFGVFTRENDTLIGRVNLSNVVREAWQSCTIGYFIDESSNSKGYMTLAVRLACQFAFEEAGLHRVQAAVMPHNIASIRVLEKNGFNYEGLAKYYLKINDKWEDHRIYSITKEYWG